MRSIMLSACLLLLLPSLPGLQNGLLHGASAGTDASEGFFAPQGDEVLLTFRYRGVGNVYVTGLYDYGVDKMFLPVTELFNLLQIYHEPSPGDFTVAGSFLDPDKDFRIFFAQQRVVLAGREYVFERDDFRIGEMDFFASPKVFEDVFRMAFTVNMNALILELETVHTMPVEEAAERARARQLIEAREVTREFFPLEYDRNRQLAEVGFLDYNLSGNLSRANPSMSYNLLGGAEVLGGDIQGSVSGSWSETDHNVRFSNLRWRYVVRDTPWFSTFQAGQMSTTGLQARSIRGASISNEPIEPYRIYESYIIDGTTEPDSEVELYLNNRLIDFHRADAVGYYRFEFPLTYGTTQLTIQIYTPTGEVRTIDRRLQIPFTFLPPGEIAYNIQGGQTETFLGEGEEERWLMQGDVAMGVTGWLTARLGSEYIRDLNENRPMTYGSLSARVLSQYLINLDVAPDALYRGTGSVMFPSGRSISLQYTHYQDNPLFGMGGADQDVHASFFTPFTLFAMPMSFRIGGDHRTLGNNSVTRFRTDVGIRIGRMNVRANYRDALFYSDDAFELGQGRITGSLTYTFMRSPGIPVLVRGIFLRGNLSYNTAQNSLEDLSLQLSRSIRQWGRINLDAGYDLRSEQHSIRLGFIMDLVPFRSTTTADMRGERASVRQNLRGSLGFDRNPDQVVMSNRNQVGRAGASVILFVDNNNSGTFDEGDEIIPARAIRLDRSAQMAVGRDGILRISQLQSYFQYNLEVIRQALPNPLLVPDKDRFSFIADPNQYKRIEIPFYRSGVIDGRVFIVRDGMERGQGGLRLLIRGVDLDYEDTVRNFSDGSYYAMDLPPGEYTIEVDPTQLDFLRAHMPDGPKKFKIRALADGDFIENLNILLLPRPDEIIPELLLVDDAGVGDKYFVALNRFSSIYRAETARRMAMDRIGEDFFIHYLEKENLFLVFSSQMEDPADAQVLLDNVLEKGFAVAYVGSAPPPGPERMRFTIQLESFRSESQAIDNMRNLSSLLDVPLMVRYNELTSRHILVTKDYPDIPEALEALQHIRLDAGLIRAFLTSTPYIPYVPLIITYGSWH